MAKPLTKQRRRNFRIYLEEALELHPQDVVSRATAVFSVSRQTVNRHLNELVSEGLVEAGGNTRARQYRLAVLGRFEKDFPLAGLDESEAWRWHAKSFFETAQGTAMQLGNFCFTEMLNNAIDHSEGTFASITIRRTVRSVRVEIRDDGVGVFKKIKDSLGLAEESHAVLEIAKGKFTTDPQHHSGMGIFFSSRACDRFTMTANGLIFNHFLTGQDILLDRMPVVPGTKVEMMFDLNAKGSLAALFKEYEGPNNPGFTKTIIPVQLAEYGEENLISRSQAKRVLARVDHFKEVIWDFTGVPMIGQAFADEIFRVFLLANKDCHFLVSHAKPDVMAMIRLAISSLKEQEPTARPPEEIG